VIIAPIRRNGVITSALPCPSILSSADRHPVGRKTRGELPLISEMIAGGLLRATRVEDQLDIAMVSSAFGLRSRAHERIVGPRHQRVDHVEMP